MSTTGHDQLMGLLGIGAPGEVRAAPDGELYEWTPAIDGLGNPVGFWRRLRRRLGRLVKRALPLARQAAAFVPGPSGGAAVRAIETGAPWLRRAGLGELGELYEAPDGNLYEVDAEPAEESVQGLGQEELQQVMGLGQVGDVRRGPDGARYQWVEGLDGLGNPVGFWSRLKRLGRGLRPFLRRVVPLAARVASFVPGYGTAVAAGLRTATPFLRRAGLAGELGELYASADGTVYEIQGVADDADLTGAGDEAELSGLAAEEPVTGPTSEQAIEGLDQRSVQEPGTNGLGFYVQDRAQDTRGQRTPAEPPALFRPLW